MRLCYGSALRCSGIAAHSNGKAVIGDVGQWHRAVGAVSELFGKVRHRQSMAMIRSGYVKRCSGNDEQGPVAAQHWNDAVEQSVVPAK